MRRERYCWIYAGLALVGLVAPLLWVPTAFAQSAAPDTPPYPSNSPSLLNRTFGRGDIGREQDGFSAGQPGGTHSFGGAGAAGAGVDTSPLASASQGGLAPPIHEQGSDRSLRGLRPAVQDGDLSQPEGPTAPIDGEIDLGGDAADPDRADPTQIDTRSDDDRGAFQSPPAGFDALLFQIEDVEPARAQFNRRPGRLFTLEPYDPIGVRVGSFVLFPEVETGLNWSSNVFASPSSQADRSYTLRPSARLVSNWNVHALEFSGSAELSTFDKFKTEDARGYRMEARGRVDVTRRTNVQAVLGRDVAQESRSAVDASTAGDRPDITVDQALLSLNHRFNRLSLQLRGAVADYDYGSVDNVAIAGVVGTNALPRIRGTISNNDRAYLETRQAVRATWEFKPTLRVFGEAELIQRDYDVVSASDNISRDSQGGRYRLGVDFGSTSDIWRGEISFGYGDHRPKESSLPSIDGLIVDANLAWRLNGLTSLLLNARSDISETTTAGSSGVLDRQVGVQVRHAFKQNLIGTAGASYTLRNIAGIDVDERDIVLSLGAEYFLNQSVVLFGNYGHTFSRSDFANSDYDLDEVYVGVRVRR